MGFERRNLQTVEDAAPADAQTEAAPAGADARVADSRMGFDGDDDSDGGASFDTSVSFDASVSSDTSPDAGPPPASSLIFVTTTVRWGGFGGRVTADADCQARAIAATLPGGYRAILSDATIDAATDLAGRIGYPVRTTDGRTVEQTNLWDGSGIDAPIRDEIGDPATTWAWTGSTATGARAHPGSPSLGDCLDWTRPISSYRGNATDPNRITSLSGNNWLGHDNAGSLCNNTWAFYCIQVTP